MTDKELEQINKAVQVKDEAIEKMLTAVGNIATADESKTLDKESGGLVDNIRNLANAFTIVANRIQELDPDLQKKLQAKQQSAPKKTPKR